MSTTATMTTDAARRAAILDNLRETDADRAHAMYADDAVLEFPQSGERFIGLENIKTWRASTPPTCAIACAG